MHMLLGRIKNQVEFFQPVDQKKRLELTLSTICSKDFHRLGQ